ncbi:GntR family transcriptional regulator [Amycolatopsis thermoflava]|uniref:DNA-binding GntR family transcriptional regulator n=1 Tax=Amycolatopsis thermoflava TaxID=84480 RepID=A0A3N2G6R7_9PSEU|nr:GntR family transcriptional regulator [Amycolatopsis thermoflava]ROS32237.1 DNA-binding GntR family transcriptional regulator [Amycolatopsis thermoflava]
MGATHGRGGSLRRTSFENKQQLSEKVAAYIREGIMVGQFRAGEYIRTERLAEELGVSPTPVREALMLLGSEGSVRWEPRRGYRVVPLTTRDVGDLFRVQAFIAGELAARAATELRDEELDLLEETQAKLEQAERDGDFDLVESLNYQIHRTINKASDSARLAVLLGVTVNYVPLGYYASIEGWSSASAHDHSSIFQALRARDPEGARKAMSAHIEHVGGQLVEHLRQREVLS